MSPCIDREWRRVDREGRCKIGGRHTLFVNAMSKARSHSGMLELDMQLYDFEGSRLSSVKSRDL